MSEPLRSPVAVTVLALAALGGSFAAGSAWSGPTAGPGADPGADHLVVAAPPRLPVTPQGPGTLSRATSCDGLLAHYVDNTVDEVTAWGWGWDRFPVVFQRGFRDAELFLSPMRASIDAKAARVDESASSATGTNVQEQGVDEPDVVKTDGQLMVRLDDGELTTYDVSGARVRELARIDLPGRREHGHELLLAGEDALVLSRHHDRDQESPVTRVRRLDLADPAEPAVVSEQEYDGDLLSARLYGDTVRLVLGTGLPALDFVEPRGNRTRREALRRNREIVRASTIEDWLPSVRTEGSEPELVAGCDELHLPEQFAGAGNVVVVGHGLDSPDVRSSVGVAAASSTVYSSADRLYLATVQGWGWGRCCVALNHRGSDDGTTDLHAFALDGPDATYVGSGEVEGTIADRWAMDSADGVLRVAVGPSSETGNFNSVVTLAEDDGRLVERGRVDRLGVNEQIKSVRWFDDLAIVVTFRQVDPLYVIDLADPLRPRKVGELKIPGFSSYLHPIGDDRLIGLGTDATMQGRTRGGQAAVFDIGDLRDPRRLDTHGYGRNREVQAAHDPRQFTWLPGRRTALTVVGAWGRTGGATGWISALEVADDGTLTNTMVRGTYGWDDVQSMRTVPLPDGRVVLSTEDGARFLPL